MTRAAAFASRALLSLAVLGVIPVAAQADGGRRLPAQVPPAYTAECGSCHLAYPPGLLPARAWLRVMSGLQDHYGTDASLDPATVQQLSAWLVANAGTYKRVREEPPEDRLTRSAWFERKHRGLEPAAWKLASVRSAANCAACHTRAEQGEFDEHQLRIPAGLDARSRRAFHD
ncbi:diheme cytochrome c [Ramlibacter tataouinensis]|uniref:diheme cytochrome c n=1 Tax=Ramlibacter tataouinensis TaxID=94132 RepID=UPI0022F3ED8B|nr:diheme cytochrome c [Ramlibacter tataouinensis]WBY00358.1 diheme cytochrome c [Ramlibacter tataouinensis]